MTTARTQLVLLALTLGIAAGGLFIPAPRGPEPAALEILAADGASRAARTLARAAPLQPTDVRSRPSALVPGALVRGPRPDVVIVSTDSDAFARLRADGNVAEPGTTVVTLPLAIIQPRDRAVPASPLLSLTSTATRRIAIAPIETDAGRLARDALENLGLWYRLLEQGRLRRCRSAAAAIAMVGRGDADAGIVLLPEAVGDERVTILANAFPAGSYAPVPFRAYAVPSASRPGAAKAFLDWLGGDDARALTTALESGRWPATPAPRAGVLDAVLLSIRAACLSIMLVFPIAVVLGAWLAGRRAAWARIVAAILDLPLVLPPVAVGLAMLWLLAREGPVHRVTGIAFAHTWQAGALAAGIVALPLALRPIRRAIEAIDPRQRHVADTLGIAATTRLLLVRLPLAARGMLAGLVLAFARAAGEFGATLVVAGALAPSHRTIAHALLADFEGGGAATGALLGASAAIALLATLAAQWVERREDGNR